MLEGAEVRLAVDIGGTFTDIVLDAGQDRKTRKVLTTPTRPEEAVLDGMRLILADARAAHLRHRRLHSRHDARDQRHHRAPRRAHGADRHARVFATCSISAPRAATTSTTLRSTSRSRWCRARCASRCPSASTRRARCGCALDEAAVRALVARSCARQKVRERRDRLPALLCQSRRTSGAPRAILNEEMPGRLDHAVVGGVPGDPRIRAHLDGGRQCLCAAADRRLSRAHGRGAAGRAVSRRHLSRDVGRRRHLDRDGAALSGAAGRIRAGRRRDLRGADRGAPRREQGAVLRHGRHHRQDLPDRKLPARNLARVRGRSRGPLPERARACRCAFP